MPKIPITKDIIQSYANNQGYEFVQNNSSSICTFYILNKSIEVAWFQPLGFGNWQYSINNTNNHSDSNSNNVSYSEGLECFYVDFVFFNQDQKVVCK